MESAHTLKNVEIKSVERLAALKQWLFADCGYPRAALQSMHGDASFRRYFRIQARGQSYVVMDASPPAENCYPYAAITTALRGLGLKTPEIINADLERGFLVITDFGDDTYLKTLNTRNVDTLYHRALNALSVLQGCRTVQKHAIPPFTADFMRQEWSWHKEWVLNKMLGLSPIFSEKELDQCYEVLIQSATSQPQVFMHRDYHSGNLMTLADGDVAILDFQDAFIGPVTYDLVSLLRDCYIDWPRERVNAWALEYYQRLHQLGVLCNVETQEFIRWFDLMGIQRHLKALMTFSRKHVRDHQSQYLNYVPRTLQYLLTISREYRELDILHEYLRIAVQPAFERVIK